MKKNNSWVIVGLLLAFCACTESEARGRRSAVRSETDPAEVSMPVDEEVCFAPEEPCDAKLERFVESAQNSVDVAIYDLNLDRLVHDLLVASKKLNVRIVVDRRQAKEKNSAVPLLVKAGAKIRYGHQRGIMHNKFIIVDGKMLESGSFNYTHHAAFANNENQIYLTKAKVMSRFKSRFEKLWSDSDPIEDFSGPAALTR